MPGIIRMIKKSMAKSRKSGSLRQEILIILGISIIVLLGLFLWFRVQAKIPASVVREISGSYVSGTFGASAPPQGGTPSGGTGSAGNLDTANSEIETRLNALDSNADSITESLNETPADLSE